MTTAGSGVALSGGTGIIAQQSERMSHIRGRVCVRATLFLNGRIVTSRGGGGSLLNSCWPRSEPSRTKRLARSITTGHPVYTRRTYIGCPVRTRVRHPRESGSSCALCGIGGGEEGGRGREKSVASSKASAGSESRLFPAINFRRRSHVDYDAHACDRLPRKCSPIVSSYATSVTRVTRSILFQNSLVERARCIPHRLICLSKSLDYRETYSRS